MNFRFNQTLRMLAVAGVIGSLAACGGGGGGNPVTTPPAEVITAPYKYLITFVDARTDAPITDTLTVQFTGPAVDSGEVLDSTNKSVKGKSYTTTNGLITAAANFNGSNDVFSVLGGNLAKGWNTSGVQILRETSKLGDQIITVRLNNNNNAAAIQADTTLGIGMVAGNTTAGVGGVLPAVTLSTTDKTVTNAEGSNESVGTAKITIPAGTIARDAAGNVASGALKLTVTKYANSDVDALAAFPGGFSPNAVLANGTTATGNFVTGGFAQFNLTDSTGKAIKKFDTPIQLTIDLPKTSKNPSTGALLKAGDTYPVWSFDEVSGKWVFEADGQVREKTPVNASNFEVVFSSTHLSYWNLDYFGSDSCTGTINIARNPASDARPLYIDIVGVTGSRFYRSYSSFTDSTVTLLNSPRINVNVTLKDSKGNVVGSSLNQNLCSGVNVSTIQLPAITYATLQTNVTESCPDGVTGKRAVPTYLYFQDAAYNFQGGYYATGTSTIGSIESGTNGTLWVWNRFTNQWQTSSVAVNAPTTTRDINFPNLQCVTGSFTPTGGVTGAQ
jgi:hypothetical protein